MNLLASKSYKICFIVISLLFFVSTFRVNKREFEFKRTIHADAVGYYSWLPAVFIYHDGNFAFIDTVFRKRGNEKKYNMGLDLTECSTGKKVNKYSCGVAVCAMPFWFISHLLGKLLKQDQGCEEHYQFWWFISAIFFVLMGIYFLFRMAQIAGQAAWKPTLISALILFGTNLFQYSSFDIGYSHGYTFCWGMVALFALQRYNQTTKWKYIIWFAFACGILFIIRPVNVILFPIFTLVFMNIKSLQNLLKTKLVLLWVQLHDNLA